MNPMDRRDFSRGMGAAGLLMALPVAAHAGATVADWAQLAALSDEARKQGINVPQVSVPSSGETRFQDVVRAIVDFIDALDASAAGANAAAIPGLKSRGNALLNAVNARERSPHQKSGSGAPVPSWLSGFIGSAQAATVEASQRYERYRDGYLQLFDTCKTDPVHQSTVDWYVSKLTSVKYREQYEHLEDRVCVPWYFIGVIHALEASFNFEAHLHNGDPLSRRTTHVPANRPEVWNPPSDWQSSAADALKIENFTDHTDWNLARLLFRIEAYNGFRSRELHDTNSPYLWSFSNHYAKGKFVADNQWSGSAVSQQCGAAVMIKELVDKKVIQLIV